MEFKLFSGLNEASNCKNSWKHSAKSVPLTPNQCNSRLMASDSRRTKLRRSLEWKMVMRSMPLSTLMELEKLKPS
ncbi:hypothetical protein GBA52_005650 [Prunus armeniaca]|nr:hypothetical protein GBA52_005650 [Prunus armeniaca]